MSAELLRQAAALMRKESRTEWMLVVVNRRTSCGAKVHHQIDPDLERKFGRRDPSHPKWCNAQPSGATEPAPSSVALTRNTFLAVADWLEAIALEADDYHYQSAFPSFDRAVAVARAYLGGNDA